jgi:hypothetical protein
MQNEYVITAVDIHLELSSWAWSPNNDETSWPVISYVSVEIATSLVSTPLDLENFKHVINQYEVIYLITS